MDNTRIQIFVIEDDASTLVVLRSALEASGYRVQGFASADAFLAAVAAGTPGVLLTDLTMPGLSGQALLERLNAQGWDLPVIVISIHQDAQTAVKAVKAGAMEYLCKPVDPEQLLAAVRGAASLAQTRERQRANTRTLLERLSRLSPREREVLALITSGLSNKLVAAHVGLAEKTVEIHRAAAMRKMEAESFAHLVRIVVQIEQAGVKIMPARAGIDAA